MQQHRFVRQALLFSRRSASRFHLASVATRSLSPKVAVGVAFASLAVLNASMVNNISTCKAGPTPHEGVAGTNQERNFIAVKPDGVQRGLIGDILARFEKRGYKVVGIKMVWPTKKMAEEHYADLSSRPFFPRLTFFSSSGPIVCYCFEGLDVIKQGRAMLGASNPQDVSFTVLYIVSFDPSFY